MEGLDRALDAARRQGVDDDLPVGTTIDLPSTHSYPTPPEPAPGAPRTGLAALPAVGADDLVYVERIGQGGQATVDAVVQTALSREVAVKRPLGMAGPEAREGLLNEARLTGALEHPNVIPVHLLVRRDGLPLMVMKRVEGVSWHELIADPDHPAWEGRPADRLVAHLEILARVCRAVEYAHSRGIVHLDIKPGNVMVGQYGEVYLMDWGIGGRAADLPGEDPELVTGTPSYMAPEMVEGRRFSTLASDIYLLGSTLHRVLTGRVRNHGAKLGERFERALLSRPVAYDADVPPELGAICNTACSRRAERRFASVRALREAVEAYVRHRGAVRIIRSAKAQLAELEMLAAGEPTDAWRPGAHQERQMALATAVRFGFEHALSDWPDNQDVIDGLQRALELSIELELDRGLPEAARALVVKLPRPRPDLAARADALVEEVRARGDATARLKKIEFDFDFAGEDTRRSLGFALNGVCWSGLALLWGLAVRAGLIRNTPQESLLLAVAGTAAIALSLYQVRGLMLDNRIRRRFTAAFAVYVGVFDLNHLVGFIRDMPLTDLILADHAILVAFVGFLAALIHRALFAAFAIAVAALLATALWPDRMYEIIALDLLGINFVFAWVTRPGTEGADILAGGR